MHRYLPVLILFATSCSSMISFKAHELQNATYRFKQKGRPWQKVDVVVGQDSLRLTSATGDAISLKPGTKVHFQKYSVDPDVMVVPFKYRPASVNLPRQLNTDFNGNLFVGFRADRFTLRTRKGRTGIRKKLYHSAVAVGGFAGIGSTFISPWTTNNMQPDEYEGFILSRGISALVALNSLTAGIGVGWDYLTDRDKAIWIYQNKPWLGLTLGLNLTKH